MFCELRLSKRQARKITREILGAGEVQAYFYETSATDFERVAVREVSLEGLQLFGSRARIHKIR